MRGPGRKPAGSTPSWTKDFAYGVGLMASDGNLSPDGRHLVFVSKDLEQAETLKDCFKLHTDPVQVKTSNKIQGRYYRLQWSDVILYRFLESIGLSRNKSKTLGPLAIPEPLFGEFLRGLFDGDGSFYSYFDPRWKSSFMFYVVFVSASNKFMSWIQKEIQRLYGLKGHTTTSKDGSCMQLRYAKKESLLLLKVLYHPQTKRFLKRKRLKIMRALRIVGKSLMR